MEKEENNSITALEQALSTRISSREVKAWLKENAYPFQELMAFYKCALMEVETKFRVLNEYFSIEDDCNHIESIHTRIKSPLGIIDKMRRYGLPLTVENIEHGLHDIAGVRVVCSFVSDIFMLEQALLGQDDVRLIERKDYISSPKPNGYRSLHLIIDIPIYLNTAKRNMKVEVQLRTLAMDTWASLEHKIRYKKNNIQTSLIDDELSACARICAELDERLEHMKDINYQ